MFYSCDLLFFRAVIFEAEKHRHVGPLPGYRNMVLFYNADQRGPICIHYILRGENLQTLTRIAGRFFADFGTFKPYNFGIA